MTFQHLHVVAVGALGLTVFGACQTAAPQVPRVEKVELVARLAGAMPTGVTVSPSGRTFLSYPQWGDDVPFAVGELRLGTVTPFPSQEMNTPDPARPSERFVSVQSVLADGADRLWILDTGAPKFQAPVAGGAKLVAVDLATDRVVKTLVLGPDVVLPTTYLNDLRVDLRQGTEGVAYVTDSSVRGPGALIVVDLASGRALRRLSGHASVTPERGFLPTVEGQPVMNRPKGEPASPWLVASDGIAISSDGASLYYCPLSSRRLYRVPTSVLRDARKSDADIASQVVDLGLKAPSDGLAEDDRGRIYAGDYEHGAINRFDHGTWATIAEDPRILWPDTLSVGPDGYLYFTANQLHRRASFHEGMDLRRQPYELLRIHVGAGPVLLR